MKSKYYLFFVLLLMGAMLLVACGGNNTADEPEAPAATEAPAEEEAMEEAPAATEAPAPTEAPAATEAPAEEEVMADEQVIRIWHGWDGTYYDAIEEVFNEYTAETGVKIELIRQDNLSDAMAVAVPGRRRPRHSGMGNRSDWPERADGQHRAHHRMD